MGTWYAPARTGQRPCVLSQTVGSLLVDPGLCVGVEAVGGGKAEWTPISSKGCLAGSSGFCAPQGFVGEAWDPSID